MPNARTGSLVGLAAFLGLCTPVWSAGVPASPPTPAAHFNDYAGFVNRTVAARLDARLAECERETGAQVLVAVFPKLPEQPMEAFTLRTANAWAVGREGHDDGVVLFVFVQDRKHRIEVGRGLRQKLPDRLAKQILDELVAPQFRAGRPDAGLDAGVEALIGAVGGKRRSMLAPSSTASGRASSASEGLGARFWALLGLVVSAAIVTVTLVLLRDRPRPAELSPAGSGAIPAVAVPSLGGGGATLGAAGEWDSRQFATLRAAASPKATPKRRRIRAADLDMDAVVDDTFEGLTRYAQEPATQASYASDVGTSSSTGGGSFESGGGSFDGGGSSGSW